MPDNYLETVSGLLARAAAGVPDLVQMGENIAQGSRLCGLARHLAGHVVNVGNCENTHVGAGLGIMLGGGRALLVVKQLDFLLLALDQMVNTTNLIEAAGGGPGPGSFTIVTIVCDQGWQGPQSSFHDLAGMCALARVNGFHINGAADAERVFTAELGHPGFRLIAVSQKRFGEPALACPVIGASGKGAEFQYAAGSEGGGTIAAFGFALPEALALAAQWHRQSGAAPAVFQLNPTLPYEWPRTVAAAARSARLAVLDDGKGPASLAHRLALAVLRATPNCHVSLHTRESQAAAEPGVHDDRYAVAAGAA